MDNSDQRRSSGDPMPAHGQPAEPAPRREPAIHFYTERVRPLSEVRATDFPRGLDPEDAATDIPETHE